MINSKSWLCREMHTALWCGELIDGDLSFLFFSPVPRELHFHKGFGAIYLIFTADLDKFRVMWLLVQCFKFFL